MNKSILIRKETKDDIEAIFEITKEAFKDHPHGDHTEHYVVNALRDADALTVSLVAEKDKKAIGHIAFSPVTISDGSAGWYTLGPVSVLPECQRQGIGRALILHGMDEIRALHAKGCVLVGDPGYYGRFGFRNIPGLTIEGVPQEVFLAFPFGKSQAKGTVTIHKAFFVKGE